MTARVPVIDVGALRADDPAALRELAEQIGRAARETGFFSIVNHGIPTALIDELFAQSRAFFALPLEAKERVSIERSPAYRGFSRIGFEQFDAAHPADAKESFDIGPDRNLWPDLPGFRAAMEAAFTALGALTVAMHRPIALDLGLDERFFDRYFRAPLLVQRLLWYPPHPGDFDGTLHGSAPHTDYGNLTFLAQDDAGGLELQMRDGTWLAIEPTADAFVCNIGDCLMRWSNDAYVSTPHRVVNRSSRERFSIAINSINDNTAAYSLISTGVRIPRHVSAIVTSACGFALAVAGAGTFAALFSNYLLLLLYWIAPWAGIVLTDWFIFRGRRPAPTWGTGAAIFALVTPLTIALFSATEIYTGPIAKLLGGADIGFFVGFFVASTAYLAIERTSVAALALKSVR